MSDDCCLCAQVRGESELDLLHAHLGGGIYRRRLAALGGGWYGIPSVGSLVPGHVLFCPGRHVRSFALLLRDEVDDIEPRIGRLARRLTEWFGGVAQLFEHGNAET